MARRRGRNVTALQAASVATDRHDCRCLHPTRCSQLLHQRRVFPPVDGALPFADTNPSDPLCQPLDPLGRERKKGTIWLLAGVLPRECPQKVECPPFFPPFISRPAARPANPLPQRGHG